MYQITVEQHFDAAHFLRGYHGKCEATHGHRFLVIVTLQAKTLDEIGMAYDFTVLKRQVSEIIGRFDHVCLNDVPPFDKVNPSSENIASVVFNELQIKLADASATITRTEVWETPQNRAAYIPD
jgi:6-pyruvoyltetrahydropterin/6-carboxytetrahydropterin synthase|tara:strand:+ start:5399 stop:5770 length:372 start_codon:yes stop_codon:yes gene_type:complete